jgi:hypothetical protein
MKDSLAADIVDAICSVRIPSAKESAMQETVERVLSARGMAFVREHRFSEDDRIDFLVGSIGVECKISGSIFSVAEQLERYARHSNVQCLILVTSANRHFSINGLREKPLVIVRVGNEF